MNKKKKHFKLLFLQSCTSFSKKQDLLELRITSKTWKSPLFKKKVSAATEQDEKKMTVWFHQQLDRGIKICSTSLVSTLYGQIKKKETDQENRKLFYGPPTNCSDPTIDYRLHLIWFLHMVKITTNDEKCMHNITIVDAVYCTFK